MIKFYESQEERNSFQKIFDKNILSLLSDYKVENYLTLLVNEKNNIVTGYHYSDSELVGMEVDGIRPVFLGKTSYDVYRMAIMCVDDYLDSFPVYDFDKEVIGLVRLVVEGTNCTLNELTGKWELKDGETIYKFNYFVDDPICDTKNYENVYIKMQDKIPENAEINGKTKVKINLPDRGKFTIKNKKGTEQTFKIKATLTGEDTIWLVKYITVV